MDNKFIVVVKYKDDEKILFHSWHTIYEDAEKARNALRKLGHITDVISIG